MLDDDPLRAAFRIAIDVHERAVEVHERAAAVFTRNGDTGAADRERRRADAERAKLRIALAKHPEWARDVHPEWARDVSTHVAGARPIRDGHGDAREAAARVGLRLPRSRVS